VIAITDHPVRTIQNSQRLILAYALAGFASSGGFFLARKTMASESTKGSAIMKIVKLAIIIAMIAVALFLILPNLSWAASEGATLYQSKCAMCHGADLAGKPAAKIPSLISDEAKQQSDADLTDAIANGGKNKKASHAFATKGVTPDQVKMVIAYIRDTQKK
jgi:cytochrome c6